MVRRKRWVKRGVGKTVGWRKTGRFRIRKKKNNPLAGRMPNSLRLFRADIEAMIPVFLATPVVGLNGIQIVVPLNYPTYARNPAGTYGQITNASFPGSALTSVWPRFVGAVDTDMFDEYRVMRLVIKFVPVGVHTQTTTSNYPARDDPTIMYHYNDMDDCGAVGVPIEAKYMNSGAFPIPYTTGPIVTKFRQPKEKRKFFLNSQNVGIAPDATMGTQVSSNVANFPSPYSSIKMYWPFDSEITTTQHIGRLYIRWECIFRGINSTAS